ncbi:MAG: hypothetical protein WCO00_16930 [Rhodospirillaceae bacterium]
MSTISSSLPALSYLALPAPGAGATASTVPNGTPVQPVPPVTRRAARRDDSADDSRARAQTSGQTAANPAAAELGGAPRAAAAGLSASAPGRPSPGFLAQSLSQEQLGSGLHIEPWTAALASYRNAATLPASAARRPGVVV